MKLNWFERAVYNYKRVPVLIPNKEYLYLDRLINAVNFTLDEDDDDYTVDDLICLLIELGIKQALNLGFTPFAKAFYHYMESREFTNGRARQELATLHSTEIKAINDLVAMINEYMDDEHSLHGQTRYEIDQGHLIRFFIRKGCEGFQNMPVPKIAGMLRSASN